MMHSRLQKIKAFTLLEIIVAMSIAAVIGVYALILLDKSTQSHNRIKETGNRYNNIERAFLFLSNDIRQIAPRSFRDEYGDKKNNLYSDDIEGLTFTRLGRRNPAGLARSSLEKLNYRVEQAVLYRTSYTYPDGMPEELGNKRALLENVVKLSVYFYQDEEWIDFWPPQRLDFQSPENSSTQLPVAVKILLELTDLGKVERLFVISDQQNKNEK